MLLLTKIYKNTIYVYISADKRYEYVAAVQSEPKKKTRLVVVTIYDHKYQYDDINHQPQSCTSYTCYNYRLDSMLKHCQYLFDSVGLYRNGIGTFADLQCRVKENL